MTTIHTEWTDDDHTIILFTFETDWTWQDFSAAGNLSMEMMSTVDHPVIQIFDMRNAHNIPRNTFSNGRQALGKKPHPNMTKVIVVGMNGYFNAIFRAFEKMLPPSWIDKWSLTFVASLEEAVEMAHRDLTNLPESQ